MSTKTSLHRTLGIGLTVGVTLLWLLGVTASGLVAQHEINEVFDSALEETAQRILPLAVSEILSREDTDSGAHRALIIEDHDEYLTYIVRDPRGNPLLLSHDADIGVFDELPGEGFSETASHRIYGASAISETIFIEVAEPLAHRREAAVETALALLLPLIALVPLSLLGVWWIIKLSLRSVVIFQHSIEARGAGDLSPVAIAQLPAELEPVALAVNQLIARLRRALDAERSFTANSAHELRTPLATALAKVQRLKPDMPASEMSKNISEIEASLRTLAKLSEKLLELAKAEGGGALAQTPHNLVPILEMLVGDFQRQAPGRIRLSLPERDVSSILDPDAFAILLRNLIENALKHGHNPDIVDIILSEDGTLHVINSGDIVPAQDLPLLQQRFVRASTSVPGSGLGLAIVAAIAEGAGIKVTLQSPASGRQDGFEVSLNVVITHSSQ